MGIFAACEDIIRFRLRSSWFLIQNIAHFALTMMMAASHSTLPFLMRRKSPLMTKMRTVSL